MSGARGVLRIGLAALALGLAATAAAGDEFSGRYRLERDGEDIAELVVRRDGEAWTVSMDGEKPTRFYPASEHKRREIYGYGRKIDDSGLESAEGVTILKVPRDKVPCLDFQSECVPNRTGYFFQFYALLPLRKIE